MQAPHYRECTRRALLDILLQQEEGARHRVILTPWIPFQGWRTLAGGVAPRTQTLQAPGCVPVYPALGQGRSRPPGFLPLLRTTWHSLRWAVCPSVPEKKERR